MGSASIISDDDHPDRVRDKMSPKNESKVTGSTSPKIAKQNRTPQALRLSPNDRTGSKKVACSCSSPAKGDTEGKAAVTPKSGTPFKAMKKNKSSRLDFNEYTQLSQRLTKSMYYAKKMPSVSRPSFPLTVLAVNAFTSTNLGTKLDTLEFLDLELASEIGINACVSPTTLILTLVYLDRLHSNNPGYLKSIKPSELFVISLLVASKFIQDDGEDCGIYNDEWAASARMETKDVNRLEIEFLTAIDWNVNVSRDEFDKALQNLECRLAQQEGEKRGTFTYTELEKLSNAIWTLNLIWPIVYDYVIKVIIAASITYATLVTTLLTSSFVVPTMVQLLSRSLPTTTQAPSLRSNQPHSGYDRMTTATFYNNGGQEQARQDVHLQIPDLENLDTNNLTIINNGTNAFRFSNSKTVFYLESQEYTCSKSRDKDRFLKDKVAGWSSFHTDTELKNLRLASFDYDIQPGKLSFYEARLQDQLTNYQTRSGFGTLYDYNSCRSANAIRLTEIYKPQFQQLESFARSIAL